MGLAEKEKKKKLSFRSVTTRPRIENSKKIAKKFNKLKNIISASFHAKIGRERQRKREKKNYRSDQFLLDAEKRISKKFKKLKNILMASFKAKTGWERLIRRLHFSPK